MEQSEHKVYTNDGNQEVLRWIEKENAVVLDVGCGGGTLAKILQQKGFTVDGITISKSEQSSSIPFTRDVYIFNLENGLPEEVQQRKYDYVVCSHVLEHIVYPEKVLTDIFQVLKPDGLLIVALPNIMHYKSRLRLLKGEFKYEHAGIWDYTHVKWYTFDSAKKLLQQYGFNLSKAYVTGQIPFYSVTKKMFPKQINDALYQGLIKISKGLFGYQIVICANRK